MIVAMLLCGDSHIAHSKETFRRLRGHSHDFQGIKFRRLWARQDLLDCPAERLLLVNTRDRRSELTSKAEEGPSRFADFSIQSAPIEILDQSPARHTGLTFESQGFRQECALLDQDRPRLDGVWHWGLSSASLVAHCSAAAGAGRLDVSVGLDLCNWSKPPSSCHFSLEGQDIDLFVFQRLPRFSNNFTSDVERGPGLAFESHGFGQKSAFLDQPGFRIDCVCHYRLHCVCRVAQDCHARSFTVTRLAGLDLLSTS